MGVVGGRGVEGVGELSLSVVKDDFINPVSFGLQQSPCEYLYQL